MKMILGLIIVASSLSISAFALDEGLVEKCKNQDMYACDELKLAEFKEAFKDAKPDALTEPQKALMNEIADKCREFNKACMALIDFQRGPQGSPPPMRTTEDAINDLWWGLPIILGLFFLFKFGLKTIGNLLGLSGRGTKSSSSYSGSDDSSYVNTGTSNFDFGLDRPSSSNESSNDGDSSSDTPRIRNWRVRGCYVGFKDEIHFEIRAETEEEAKRIVRDERKDFQIYGVTPYRWND